MSRVGNSAIAIPSGVTVSQQDGVVVVKGKNGELSAPLHSEVELVVADDVATVKPRRKTKLSQSLWGTMRDFRASWKSMVLAIVRRCRGASWCLTLALATRSKWLCLLV